MRPSYAPQHASLVQGDLVTWEVVYDDNSMLREAQGARYRDIDRSRLKLFRLVQPGECLFETWPPEGLDGRHLVYRRRCENLTDGSRSIQFLIGWHPHGPAYMIDPARALYREEPRGFVRFDPEMYPPTLLEDEGEGFLLQANIA